MYLCYVVRCRNWDSLEIGILRMMKNCKDGCPKLKSVGEEKSMDVKLDDCYL